MLYNSPSTIKELVNQAVKNSQIIEGLTSVNLSKESLTNLLLENQEEIFSAQVFKIETFNAAVKLHKDYLKALKADHKIWKIFIRVIEFALCLLRPVLIVTDI